MAKILEISASTIVGLAFLWLVDSIFNHIGLYDYYAIVVGLISFGAALLAIKWCLVRLGLLIDEAEHASQREAKSTDHSLLTFTRGKGGRDL